MEIKTDLALSAAERDRIREAARSLEAVMGASALVVHVMPRLYIEFEGGGTTEVGVSPWEAEPVEHTCSGRCVDPANLCEIFESNFIRAWA